MQEIIFNNNGYEFKLIQNIGKNYALLTLKNNDEMNIYTTIIDLMDNTIFTNFTENSLQKLSLDELVVATDCLNKTLIRDYGAKSFTLFPKALGMNIPHFSLAKDTTTPKGDKFDRTLFSNLYNLEYSSNLKVQEYSNLAKLLDKDYKIAIGIEEIIDGFSKKERYTELTNFFDTNAAFTKDKMKEYKDEEIAGMQGRWENKFIIPIAILRKSDGRICFTLRALQNNNTAYLSDEIVEINTFELENFKGNNPEEKDYNRRVFLIAYLFNKACRAPNALAKFDNFIIVGAAGRVEHYLEIGFNRCLDDQELNKAFIMLKLMPPGPVLQNLKDQIQNRTVSENITLGFISHLRLEPEMFEIQELDSITLMLK